MLQSVGSQRVGTTERLNKDKPATDQPRKRRVLSQSGSKDGHLVHLTAVEFGKFLRWSVS